MPEAGWPGRERDGRAGPRDERSVPRVPVARHGHPYSQRQARLADDRKDRMRKTPAGRRWRPRRRRDCGPARGRPGARSDDLITMAGAMQLAIGLLTAGVDSPELEEWAVHALIPEEPAAMGDLLAGSYVVSQLLLHELQDATGQPPGATLQRLAILAASLRGTPFTR